MSNSDPPPPKPNGSEPDPPESGSFLGLSRSGSSPWEKPKGRSAMPQRYSPADRRAGPRVTLSVNLGRIAQGYAARTFTVVAVNRRISTLLVAMVPILAFGVLLSLVTVPYVSLGPGPTFDTLGEVEGKQVVDIKGADVIRRRGI